MTSSMLRKASAILLAAASPLIIAVQAPSASAQQPLKLSAVAAVVDCQALAKADISAAVGAPTHITAASVVEAKPASYCKVEGYVEPTIKFIVQLPVANWTQRLVQTGCGGLCGSLRVHVDHDDGCPVAQNGELAITSTDMGHEGNGPLGEGDFGNDYQLRVDFAYRGVHMTTVAAKALIARYYGQAPKFAYFMGCSDGGREALMEAQRYPEDFNGITAGAPAMNFITQNTFYHGWNALINLDANGKPILLADRLPILHKAIVEQCDALDGLKDGLISDPFGCHPNPATAQCKPGQDTAACLTPAEVHVAEELYKGAHDAQGGKLVLSGPLPGSELAWAGVYIPKSATDTRIMSPGVATGVLKFLAYDPNPAAYQLSQLKFDRATFDATTKLHNIYDATDPNLKPYSALGGKLILWHGLADPHISPLNTVAYYTAMRTLMGPVATDKFARLYLFPGGYHCGGGEGPFNMDLLTPIMAWVEHGTAPGALVASHTPSSPRPTAPAPLPNGVPPAAGTASIPPEASFAPAVTARPDRTRPIYPYPYTAKYTGKGSSDDAANFVQGPANPVPAAILNWFGSGFYSAGYEKWCSGTGTTYACKTTR